LHASTFFFSQSSATVARICGWCVFNAKDLKCATKQLAWVFCAAHEGAELASETIVMSKKAGIFCMLIVQQSSKGN
jgi:hypothetical protein